jgi:hypothetical protein
MHPPGGTKIHNLLQSGAAPCTEDDTSPNGVIFLTPAGHQHLTVGQRASPHVAVSDLSKRRSKDATIENPQLRRRPERMTKCRSLQPLPEASDHSSPRQSLFT